MASSSSCAVAKPRQGRLRLQIVIEAGDQKDFRNHTKDAHDRVAYFQAELGDMVADVTMTHLEAGDCMIVIYDPTLPLDERRVVAILERKAMADALASIIDGRYKSQGQRMEATGVPWIYWLLVGQWPAAKADMDKLRSMKIHLNTSYPHTRVKRLANNREATIEWLRKTLRYMEDDINGSANGLNIDLPSFKAANINGRPPRLETQEEVWVEHLTVPRLIGRATAKLIAAHYASATVLMLAYRDVIQRYRRGADDDAMVTATASSLEIRADDDDLPVMRRSKLKQAKPGVSAKKRSGKAAAADTRSALIVSLDEMVHQSVLDAEGKRLVREADSRRLRETFLRPVDIELLATTLASAPASAEVASRSSKKRSCCSVADDDDVATAATLNVLASAPVLKLPERKRLIRTESAVITVPLRLPPMSNADDLDDLTE